MATPTSHNYFIYSTNNFKMNLFCRGAVTGIVLTVFAFICVSYNSTILRVDNKSRSNPGVGAKFRPKYQFGNFQNFRRKSKCKVDVVDNLATSSLKKIQDERKSRIRDVCDMCRKNRTSMECNHVTLDEDEHNSLMYRDLLVDEMHEVIYCITPKGGCTNWKKAILRSITRREVTRTEVQDFEFMHGHGLRRMSNYSKSEINHRLKTYFKFLVARNPLERLLSAYISKFGRPTGVQTEFIKYEPYIRRHGHGENSFSNFVEYLSDIYNISKKYFDHKFIPVELDPLTVDSKVGDDILQRLDDKQLLRKGSRYFNRHWAQYSTLCHPCHIDYDYIVNFETMREDVAYVLSKLGPHHECLEQKYPELFNVSQYSSSVFDEYYAKLSSNQINRIKEMYSIDLKLFNYEKEK